MDNLYIYHSLGGLMGSILFLALVYMIVRYFTQNVMIQAGVLCAVLLADYYIRQDWNWFAVNFAIVVSILVCGPQVNLSKGRIRTYIGTILGFFLFMFLLAVTMSVFR